MKRHAAAVVLAWLAAMPATVHAAVPDFDAVRRHHRSSELTVLDRRGEVVQRLRVDLRARRGEWVSIEEVSPALREAIVLGEDRRFWEHAGVDWRALAASAWANAWNTRTRGASTLTMQLAGLLDDRFARPAGGRSAWQKLGQIARATELEATWSKTQILEAWLNLVPLRGEDVGLVAASQRLFGKHPVGLDAVESAVIAALVRAPNAGPAQVTARACGVLRAMAQDCAPVAGTVEAAFVRRAPPPDGPSIAPHFARAVPGLRDAAAGDRVHTTLDAAVQRLASAALRRQMAELRGRDVDDGAVVVLDNRTGEVLAWVGSAGPGSEAPEVDGVLARRQPGSTVKPFVYALALERRLIATDSLIDDAPMQWAAGAGVFAPQNYDRGFKGTVSVRTALASSLNVPAVRVGAMLGADALFEGLGRFGLRPSESAGFHGDALALGSAEATLLDLTNAYRTLAQRGQWSPVRLRPAAGAASAGRSAVDAGSAAWIGEVLADPAARAVTFGFDSVLATRVGAAVKTGTSKDLRDNWCIGWTARHTVGVWVGNADGRPMHDVSGTTGAAPVWREVVEALAVGEAPQARAAPAVRALRVATMAAPRIVRPLDGSVFAIDPDQPAATRRVRFEGPDGHWWVDGRRVGRGRSVEWVARRGPHRIELRGADGASIDAVRIDVR